MQNHIYIGDALCHGPADLAVPDPLTFKGLGAMDMHLKWPHPPQDHTLDSLSVEVFFSLQVYCKHKCLGIYYATIMHSKKLVYNQKCMQ